MQARKTETNKKIKVIIASFLIMVSLLITVAPKIAPSLGVPEWDDIFRQVGLYSNDFNDSELPLTVHFIDVGQGDCIFIKYELCNILIDSGERGNEETVTRYIKNLGIDNLDYVVSTHPHSDHIGSMPGVFESFEVLNVIVPKLTDINVPTTRTYENFLSAVSSSGANGIYAVVGSVYTAGDLSFEILSPSEQYSELNNMSVAIRLDYKDNSFLFMGDAEERAEKDIMLNDFDIDVDVLKVGHHGSKYSNKNTFLESVAPKIAVICCGKNNSYGHPHIETLKSFEKMGTPVFRTDLAGNIVVGSDGEELTVKCSNY
ncbi:MAG TPA: ComEC/Rec2 family competence protein [Clostridia bacterium]|nr:ComEC/Rec2 family competence protein [Clostridia bacterium]